MVARRAEAAMMAVKVCILGIDRGFESSDKDLEQMSRGKTLQDRKARKLRNGKLSRKLMIVMRMRIESFGGNSSCLYMICTGLTIVSFTSVNNRSRGILGIIEHWTWH